MSEELVTGVVCMRVSDIGTPVRGSVRGHFCADCAAEVWLGGEALRLVEEGADAVCSRCIAGKLTESQIPYPTPDQVAEVNESALRYGLPPLTAEEIRAAAIRHLVRRKTDA